MRGAAYNQAWRAGRSVRMRWIIHIGAPKTGSTAIQRFLSEHRAALAGLGVHYPDVSLRGHGHHDLAFLLHGRYADWAAPQPLPLHVLSAGLRDAVRETPATTTVLSSEIFYLYPHPAAVRDLLQEAGLRPEDEVRVVCYVRRQDDAHVSWYNQTVKAQGNTATFEATAARDHGLWEYAARLQPWRDAFGPEAVLVRDYTPFGLPGNDIRADFLSVLGLPPTLFPLPPARENERINRDILDFQRWLNRLPLPYRQKRRHHKALIALTAATADAGVFDDAPFLTEEARIALLHAYAADNALLAEIYFHGRQPFETLAMDGVNRLPTTGRRGLTPCKLLRILAWIAGRRPSTTLE